MQMSGRRFRSEQFTKLDTEADRLGYQTTQRRLALKRSLAALGLYPARVRTKSRIQCKVFYEHVLALCRLSLRVRKSSRISWIALRTIQASSMLSGN